MASSPQIKIAETKYDLSLELIPYKPKLLITNASIGQLVNYFKFLCIVNPKNAYQESLNKFFRSRRVQFIEMYENCLKCKCEVEMKVKYYNLVGPLPVGMVIEQPIAGSSLLKKGKLSDIFKALYQRIEFISTREIPIYYGKHIEYRFYFVKIQEQLKKFMEEIQSFEIDFVNAINIAKTFNKF
jgi:hypothetical protein